LLPQPTEIGESVEAGVPALPLTRPGYNLEPGRSILLLRCRGVQGNPPMSRFGLRAVGW
jgi:hypothetical protein